jgi:ketosteroid isomerase-like protein
LSPPVPFTGGTSAGRRAAIDPYVTFDDAEIRAAERRLEAALEDDDPLAWVFHYTEDAVFDGGGEHAVVGRDSLLALARSMRPLRSVSIRPLRTEGRGNLAAVWTEASWLTSTAGGDPTTVAVRGLLLWRKGPDGTWRVAMEHIG